MGECVSYLMFAVSACAVMLPPCIDRAAYGFELSFFRVNGSKMSRSPRERRALARERETVTDVTWSAATEAKGLTSLTRGSSCLGVAMAQTMPAAVKLWIERMAVLLLNADDRLTLSRAVDALYQVTGVMGSRKNDFKDLEEVAVQADGQTKEMKQLLLFLAVCGCCLQTCHAQGCGPSLYSQVTKCFTSNSLELSINATQQDTQTLLEEVKTINPVIACQHREEYQKAMTCSTTSLRDCLESSGMGGFLPDLDLLQEGIKVMCSRVDEFDGDCFKAKYPDIVACGQQILHQLDKEGQQAGDLNDVICLSVDINYDCTKYHLQSCNRSTADIYLQQLDEYSLPVACKERNPARPSRQPYVSSSNQSSSLPLCYLSALLVAMSHRWSL
ncbi:hypothetical protein C0Q70_21358 [Pomacea canaliculata]|uniref:Uncharacterized protein n=1 Tax=Pomacea canaliculata TaxID=400727 RepID=A0A2T7NCC3_POMCA|nr:hypothetical protein C0Q70_21358 [Pomacea canaliculata]